MVSVFPSWLSNDSRITARIGSPAARASFKRLTTSVATPSPRPYPLARESKALDFPSPDKNLTENVSPSQLF